MSTQVTGTWNIDRSAASLVSIAKGALVAAATDNVQAIAIIACEKFGNTLAMCDSTINIIQANVVPPPTAPMLRFLKSYVGFPEHDSASQLSQSHAGLRFLCLAAALITSMEIHVAKEALHAMLKSTTKDSDFLPSPRLLRDLLRALEPRCAASGFTDLTLRWYSRLCSQVGMIPAVQPGDPSLAGAFPDPDGIRDLIDAFRQLERIGEATVTRIIIKSRGCTAWVASFTEWCLGRPPAVFTHDGRKILDQDHHDVCIIHYPPGDLRDRSAAFKVEVDHSVRAFEEMVIENTITSNHTVSMRWRGMPSIDQYGKWLLQHNGLDVGNSRRAFEQLIPYALDQVISKLRFSSYCPFDRDRELAPWYWEEFERDSIANQPEPECINDLRTHPIPTTEEILPLLRRLTGMTNVQTNVQQKPLREVRLIDELPLVVHHLRELQKSCGCSTCPNVLSSEDPVLQYCKREAFLNKIVVVLADILALSLFVFPDDLRIRIPVRHHQNERHPFAEAIFSILKSGQRLIVKHHDLLDWALALVGHDVSNELKADKWAASSGMGQAVWPAIFDTLCPTKSWFLSLKFCRGVFQHKGELYTMVEALANDGEVDIEESQNPVIEFQNRFPNLRAEWRVQVSDDILKVGLGLSSSRGQLKYATVSPARALANLSSALMAESCSHSSDEALERPNPFVTYGHPIDPGKLIRCESYRVGYVGVVAVSDMDDLRFLSLACGDRYSSVVIRKHACFSCCLRICRNTSYPILIL
ncbi:hypothetical protein BU24DRAFT_419972 [Aaosphaeria arxii CBS 175.79]|uniref:Uncharacterized protein n=1 Tax=Aaosphaeria arxii CBS 175.79 TaxID=1450172 RepID=A0A6A5XVF7_9PLEO|nr:uncharacterized protein BU24DRAFT_419972 [Aaosphaeria arxii CBS 175.79]KAF2016923.1 hypothetical protein BU24DRAFT_419972 [Aaosphaeria arxii CBS 175.79]